ncbi:hypothetical protein X975_11385, partial [Stegodyphus mimosarum]
MPVQHFFKNLLLYTQHNKTSKIPIYLLYFLMSLVCFKDTFFSWSLKGRLIISNLFATVTKERSVHQTTENSMALINYGVICSILFFYHFTCQYNEIIF